MKRKEEGKGWRVDGKFYSGSDRINLEHERKTRSLSEYIAHSTYISK